MRLDKVLAAVMIKLDPSYQQFLQEDGSIIVKLNKALYGCIESAKLWYGVLETNLNKYGMTANPKESCVFNMPTRSGDQLTIIVYVDNLMMTSPRSSAKSNVIPGKKSRNSLKLFL